MSRLLTAFAAMYLQGFRNSILGRPSSANPRHYRVGAKTANFRPFDGQQSATTYCYAALYFIALLLLGGGPAAITGFIVPVAVNSVDTRTGRSLSHVFEEVFKNSPTITHPYSSPAITSIVVNGGLITPTDHRLPAYISRRTRPLESLRRIFRWRDFDQSLALVATATFRTTSTQSRTGHNFLRAALTTAFPMRGTPFVEMRKGQDFQEAKSLTSKIDQSRDSRFPIWPMTTAAGGKSKSEGVPGDLSFGAAFAATKPVSIANVLNNSPKPKPLTYEIYSSWHSFITSIIEFVCQTPILI